MPYQSLFPLTIIMGCVGATGAGLAIFNYLENGKFTRRPNSTWFEKVYDAREEQVKLLLREQARKP